MKKSPIPQIEQLEARETPDVALSHAAAGAVASAPAQDALAARAVLDRPTVPSFSELLQPLPTAETAEGIFENPTYLQVLETIFVNSEDLQQLLDRPAKTGTAARTQTAEPGVQADGSQPTCQESSVQGCQFLCNYARKAIRNEGLKPGSCADHEDMVHQVFVNWREQVGTGDDALVNLLDKQSLERRILRKTVRQVLDHARYEQNKQQRIVKIVDLPAPVNSTEEQWTEFKIDLATGTGDLTPRQKLVLELRSQGMTFEEIGVETGMVKQRVFEIYQSAVDRLSPLYAE
jgi:hypothetical protein